MEEAAGTSVLGSAYYRELPMLPGPSPVLGSLSLPL